MRIARLVLLALPMLASCAGGGGGASPPLGSSAQPAAITEEQSDALVRMPLSVPASNDLLYVSNAGNKSITVYHHDAQGNALPISVIAGSNTRISKPGELTEDSQGNLYVLNQPSSILIFAHGAHGNVKPLRILNGPKPGFLDLGTMTVDQATGKIFVIDNNAGSTLYRFPPNSSGYATPFASVDASYSLHQMASDSTGLNLITWQPAPCCNWVLTGIDWYYKQFPSAPTTAEPGIEMFDVGGLADDPTTKTYLVSANAGIMRLAERTSGQGPDGYGSQQFTPPPISVITSAAGCGQLAIGYLRNIYAVCGNEVDVFTPNSSGNVAPLRRLYGSHTGLNSPVGIYEGK